MVVKVQLYHLGSGRQRDNHRCTIDIFIAADEWAESTGLVGEPVVFEQYVWSLVLVCGVVKLQGLTGNFSPGPNSNG